MFRKCVLIFSFFCIANFSHAAVAIIHGYDSVAAGERGFARALAAHAERWYKEFGVLCEMSDDRNLGGVLANKKLALLVYFSQPTAAQMSALRAFVKRGGKLIVFYSSSAELAALMGMKQLGYQGNRPVGHWASMRFVQAGIEGVPERIQQSSSNLLAMEPMPGQARVIAWWHDRQGRRNDAAWLASSAGYWMTHVMLADGDAAAKAQLLLALAAASDRSLWVPAARKILADAARVGGSGGAAGLQEMAVRVTDPSRRARAVKAAAALVAAERALKSRLQRGQGYQLWQDASNLQTATYEVYGLMQQPRPGEIRAVWDHSGQGLYPGNWKLTCEQLHNAGITDIYVNVAGAGFAYYNSRVLPQAAVFQEQGDQLAACLKAARPLGLRVHGWILCFSSERATAERLAIFGKRGWLIKLPGNKDSRWLDPAVPEVRAYLVKAAQEMAVNYKLDGLHLDFARYPDFNSSLGEFTRQRFQRDVKRSVNNWPADVKPGGVLHNQFAGWRASHISQFVNDCRRTLKRDAPGTLLTAAVFGKYPSCLAAVGQDWESWLNIDLVDYVTPMNYTENLESFRAWVADQSRTRSQRLRVVPGIGVSANESRLNAAQVIDQINAARRSGCPGFALFNLDTTMRQEILPVLRMGISAP
ncbi:MAG: family 10 glycosylhydrolase [Kiritimatiellae bacterium]|nr:family 10 glycosylhydrolase [Kiritimatiellia bacterium]